MTTPFRFYHCADLLLDAPFPSRAAGARAQLRAESWRTLRRLVDACLADEVAALLIAGGLFDEERLELPTERFVAGEMRRLTDAGITVVVACGRSDPGREGGRARTIEWPTERFHLVTDATGVEIAVTDAGGDVIGRVAACGHETAGVHGDLLEHLPGPGGPQPSVALLPVRPITPDARPDGVLDPAALVDRGFAYAALGRGPRGSHGEGTTAWTPGPLFPHNHADDGAAGALLVTIPKDGAAAVEFRPLATARFVKLPIDDLADLPDLGSVTARAELALDEALTDPEAGPVEWWMARVELSGTCPVADAFDDPVTERRLADTLTGRGSLLDVTIRSDALVMPAESVSTSEDVDLLGLSLQIIEAAMHDDKLLESLAPAQLAGSVSADPAARTDDLRERLAELGPLAAASIGTRNEA